MSKRVQKTLLVSTLLLMAHTAMAAFSLNGTRFIYEQGKKSISFEVSNSAKETYGGQVWIDNTNQAADRVFLVPSPPFFKLNPGQRQIVRLMNVDPHLPPDRESLFWLNVQEVPPKPANAEGNLLAIAMNTQVKVLFRPQALLAGRKDAEKKLRVSREHGDTRLTNPTPYYFAVVSVKLNGHPLSLPKATLDSLAQLAPYASVSLGHRALTGRLTVEAIDDWGGVQSYAITHAS
ncbi:Chaperone protein faeE precursor [Edwardsiella hoshinae]|uniref:Chaperone protein faeE n=1 Tax=Edwardsiella hoshinae TaxID=93378 RepID=A0A376DK65_9GAMM|nr:fimbrial chaperone [Edwardsiella hoshinae]STC90480.1 Chaperone protein faeE precursor [Edwardsiella hoshinae]